MSQLTDARRKSENKGHVIAPRTDVSLNRMLKESAERQALAASQPDSQPPDNLETPRPFRVPPPFHVKPDFCFNLFVVSYDEPCPTDPATGHCLCYFPSMTTVPQHRVRFPLQFLFFILAAEIRSDWISSDPPLPKPLSAINNTDQLTLFVVRVCFQANTHLKLSFVNMTACSIKKKKKENQDLFNFSVCVRAHISVHVS